LIADGSASAVHDVSDGGVLVAVAEMALAGRITATVNVDIGESPTATLFGEDQGCYVVTSRLEQHEFIGRAREAGVTINRLGTTLASENDIMQLMILSDEEEWYVFMADLRAAHEGFFPRLMGSELTPEF
jgi:phosphoribosylformylglycinamidine synthase